MKVIFDISLDSGSIEVTRLINLRPRRGDYIRMPNFLSESDKDKLSDKQIEEIGDSEVKYKVKQCEFDRGRGSGMTILRVYVEKKRIRGEKE